MNTITVIIETPKGSGQKYTYDEKTHFFKLTKVMPAGLVFPFDFGFIPNTKGEDGDPLDMIIISEFVTFTGCNIDCRLIGGIKANQTERNGETMRNDRFIGVPEVSQQFAHVKTMNNFPKDMINQLEVFFTTYNNLTGKKFTPLGRMEAAEANELIKKGSNEGISK